MDKKIIITTVSLFLLVFIFIAVHEFGHFYTAKYYGYNASIHFFKTTEATKNNTFFSRGIAYTDISPINNENKETIERKIELAGMWFEMVLLGIITTIVWIVSLKREDLLLIVLVGVMFAVIWALVISWNIFHIIIGSDLYYLIRG